MKGLRAASCGATILLGALVLGRIAAHSARRAYADFPVLFKEATAEVGLPAKLSAESVRIFDFNDDDYPDAFLVDTYGMPHAFLNSAATV